MMVRNIGQTSFYQLLVTNRTLSDDLQALVDQADAYKFSDGQMTIWAQTLIQIFGTHFVEAALMGGKLTMNSQSQADTNQQGFEFGVDVGLRFSSVSADIAFDFTNSETDSNSLATSDLNIDGGDPKIGNFVVSGDPASAAVTFQTWQATLAHNPAPVFFRLKEIYMLLTDPVKKYYACVAYETYLNLPSSQRYCTNAKSNSGS